MILVTMLLTKQKGDGAIPGREKNMLKGQTDESTQAVCKVTVGLYFFYLKLSKYQVFLQFI